MIAMWAGAVTLGCGVEGMQGNGVGVADHDSAAPVVYGTDNRTDVYAHADATLRARAEQSTVALVSADVLNTRNANNVTFYADTLRSSQDLCSNQRFLDDPTAAFCSGTLIDDDLVLTAGHCVTNASDCSSTRFVFNYYRTGAGTMQTVTTADIFSCRSIVARQLATVSGRELDYAVLRLDRAAAPRFTPAPVRTASSALTVGQNVAVIGSGSGIPFKIDNGGSVRSNRSSALDYFVATTDTFGGNSGSGVYETSTYTVAGILVRGDTDYVANGSCNVVNVCAASGCQGEEVTYVKNAVDAVCAVTTSARLCGTPAPPTGNTPPVSSETTFAYTATNTNSATRNTVNKTITLAAGQSITLGTCGVTGAAATGDTFLRLANGSGTEVGSNDDACGGQGSQLSFTAPSAGSYVVKAGCYGSGSCGGTVAWSLGGAVAAPPTGTTGSFTYSATNTNNAQRNTVNRTITLTAGRTITLGTCGVPGSAATGDTFLRLANGAGTVVASNDDACGGQGSQVVYTPTTSGTFTVKAGCYGNVSCGGTVAWSVP
jgi:V8-like Glu-specific endopeptidase